MLIAREELRFDFKGAVFDLKSASDRKLLGWVFNQFLYGEVTGIQCGHWLYRAPHLSAARFLAIQASEELSHVRKILRVLALLGERPAAAHPVIRFLSTGMMGADWLHHVALEMALGEGLVLGVFYAMADTLDHAEIKKILLTASLEEERHVEFGERETLRYLQSNPSAKRSVLAAAWVQILALNYIKKFVLRSLRQQVRSDHPVLSKFEEFYDHLVAKSCVRMTKLGILKGPLEELRIGQKLGLIALWIFGVFTHRFKFKPALLTSTYLSDPLLAKEMTLERVESEAHE